MKTTLSYVAWPALLLSLCAWGAVLYTAFSIQSTAEASASSAALSEQQLDRVAYAQRLSALATDTKAERDRLETLVEPDVVAIVNSIEAAGKSAHVSAKVSDALQEGGPQSIPGGAPLQAIGFVVQAEGSFSSLMQLAVLFERLPLASSIEQLEFEHRASGDPKAPPWQLTARIRVMTTSVSS